MRGMEEQNLKEKASLTLEELQQENLLLKEKLDDSLSKKICAFEVIKVLKKYKKTLFLSIGSVFIVVISAIFGMRMTNWLEIYRVLPSAVLCGIFAISFTMSIFKIKQQQDYLEEVYQLKPKKKDEDEF